MVGTVIVVASMVAIVGGTLAARRARLRVIEEAFRSLGGEPTRKLGSVEGILRGLVVHFDPYSGNRNRSRTICRLTLPVECPPFEMELRPATRWGVRDVEHGRANDLALGDPRFDESFIVEAAPAEHARALIDSQTRTAMLTFHPCQLTVIGKELRFTKAEAISEFAEVQRVLELCTYIGSRLGTMPAQLHEERLALAREGESAGYRGPSPHAIGALVTSSQGAGELAALRAMRTRRTMLRSAQAAAVVAIGIVAWLLLASSGRR
jgi:hypothetical protein